MRTPPPTPARRDRPARTSAHGFTLLEVVLALSIAIGLLAVVLHFYQQIARLRDQTLTDTTGLAAIRVCMDRLSTELRTALARPGTFRGGPDSIEFLRSQIPDLRAATAASSTNGLQLRTAPAAPANTPVRRIRYQLAQPTPSPDSAATNATASIERTEEPLNESAGSSTPDASSRSEFDELADLLADPAPATATRPGKTVSIPEVHFLALRYWDGTAWSESWNGTDLPRGVEITLATEVSTNTPANADPTVSINGSSTAGSGWPAEIFRRVVALPLAARPAAGTGAFGFEGAEVLP